jgi:beta-N-acetylhexosaminidase
MKKILLFTPLVVFVVLLSYSFFISSVQVIEPSQQPPAPTTITPAQTVSIENQLGQLFMIGHWADTPVASTTALIEKYRLGGVIIMSAPENPQDIAQWITQWNEVSETPLLIAIDQEGGPVTRLKSSQFIQTGQRDITTVEKAYEVGRVRGEELAALGINMNFAPVLDTATNPTSFMYSRTFPENSAAATLAASLIDGMSEQNVMAVAKHFPGHDDTSTDSHNELPVVNISLSELTDFTQPFAELISQNPPAALMTAHVQFPEIDSLPATLSPFFLTTYLREELGYTGLIITDDMSMDAIDAHYSTSEASQRALEAGANIILLAAKPVDIEIIFPYLITQINTSAVLRTQVARSYQRVISPK